MSIYLKKAIKEDTTDQDKIRASVAEILDKIRTHGETAVREYASRFDNWNRDFILSDDEILIGTFTGWKITDRFFSEKRARLRMGIKSPEPTISCRLSRQVVIQED